MYKWLCLMVAAVFFMTGCATTSQWVWKAELRDKSAVEIVVMTKDIERAGLADVLKAGMEGWGAAELAQITPIGYVAVTALKCVFTGERQRALQRLSIMEGEVGGIFFFPAGNKETENALHQDVIVVLMKGECTPENLDRLVLMIEKNLGNTAKVVTPVS